ncbi:MAG: tRNA (N6-threonylcarbamoyladenosine(37)-N6)-methyltransferase TrmO [Candidatus Zixiibacteriota bacterium]|nr:MAG: tRNA (N6-threonylcarbamoyladenosine(37)-N6)-methyltransferase TrmO [candidate division Zixibacteria bacterium]HDD62767.1 tRNA (N6-threonylcarbamoyladenosine(37)-N6)-methyltransferase TrmO [Chloroflexota bacterium]
MDLIQYKPVGIIHSPFKTPQETPLQSKLSKGAKGEIILQPQYEEGLSDLNKFSHIILFYHFHLSKTYKLIVELSHSNSSHGIFATRSPNRPNPIGFSVVHLDCINGSRLYVTNIDVVDGTPLLDIKPFIPPIERQYGTTLGWLAEGFDGE